MNETCFQPFTRVTRIATVPIARVQRSVFTIIRYRDGRLSITGVEGPFASGNCAGGCGQIDMGDWSAYEAAPGVDLAKLKVIWKRWHLNDMHAGTPRQMQALRTHEAEITDMIRESHDYYQAAQEVLTQLNLLVDDGYEYGSAWLSEEVPTEVLQFLHDLPDDYERIPGTWGDER
jgi:hypothetical protein